MSEDAPPYKRQSSVDLVRAGAASVIRELLLAAPRVELSPEGAVVWPGPDGAAARGRYHRALTWACDWLINYPDLELEPFTYDEERRELSLLLAAAGIAAYEGPVQLSLWMQVDRLIERCRRPIPMLLFCPNCGEQHVDAPQPEKGWSNPPHKSHECQGCGHIWRPADVATVGVVTINTAGARDVSAAPAPRT